jgi:2-polyprenyl-3-methyl-5-hydroxy-6-metoxy-1,4-benzoquinol methylase
VPHAAPLESAGGLVDRRDLRYADALTCFSGCRVPVVRGIPRFVESDGYAAAFGWQWMRFRRSQLDSHTGTTISRDRLARCLGGSVDVVHGRTVLEAGCGAGRFTEILLAAGARVVATDLSSAVDANYANCGHEKDYFVCQADIRTLPVARRAFDVVLCLGVIQHTPVPEDTVAALASYVKPGGLLVIDHYSRDYPITPARRFLRDVILKLEPTRARQVAIRTARALLPVHRALWKRRRGFGRLRGYLQRVSPLVDYYDAYPQLGRDLLSEWAVLDTHDTLTDRYKHLRGPDEVRDMLARAGLTDIVVGLGGNGVEARARGAVAPATVTRQGPSVEHAH